MCVIESYLIFAMGTWYSFVNTAKTHPCICVYIYIYMTLFLHLFFYMLSLETKGKLHRELPRENKGRKGSTLSQGL